MFSQGLDLHGFARTQSIVRPNAEYIAGVGLQQIDINERLKF